jgi:predicted O-linked N-acetylglucosamine transferase (SPINDLY family)
LAEDGIGPERIEIEGDSSLARFFEYLNGVDLALDPFPSGGETTALHCLWMGVPVIALEGNSLAGRLGSRVLRVAGLSSWVASSLDGYVTTACALAADPHALAGTRAGLRQRLQASPLLDHAGVTLDLENCYRTLWRDWCARRRPSLS